MGYCNSDIAHWWANGKKETARGSNFSFDGPKLYSYSTVIADIVEYNNQRIYFVNNASYSSSTSTHQSYCLGAIPVGAKIIFISSKFVYGWAGICKYKEEWMISDIQGIAWDIINELVEGVCDVVDSKTMNTENNYPWSRFEDLVFLMETFPIYSFNKILTTKNSELELHLKNGMKGGVAKRVLKALRGGCKNYKTLVIESMGQRVWESYVARTMSARTRKKLEIWNTLLCSNPRSYKRYDVKYDKKWKSQKSRTIYTGLTISSSYNITSKELNAILSKPNGIDELLRIKQRHIDCAITDTEVRNRELHIKQTKCRLKNFIFPELKSSYWSRIIVYNNETLEIDCWEDDITKITPEIYSRFCQASNYQEKLELREQVRAGAYERYKRKLARAEEYRLRAEEDRLQRAKFQQIVAEMRVNGDYEGIIKLWRDGEIPDLYNTSLSAEHYHGGNVLLRYVPGKSYVETSKNIKIEIEECRRLWPIMQRMHQTQELSDFTVHSTSGEWDPSRFQKDILIAGCHAIAYYEMENIAKQLNF
jgi:hypothetical protein